MNSHDPFERLRDLDPGFDAPDMGVIRDRARRRQNRKRGAMGVATAMTVLGVAFVLQPTGVDQPRIGSPLASQSQPPAGELQLAPSSTATPSAQWSGGEKSSGGLSSGTAPQSGGKPVPLAAPRHGIEVELETSSESVSPVAPLAMKMKVCNRGTSNIEVTFSSSQRYDFEITNATTGLVVWRWSDGMVFAQVLGKERFEPGCALLGEASWDGADSSGKPAEPGKYRAVAILASNPRVRSAPREVCVISCG
ncbi:MAG: BsuPI-related putative proteinase inhibitor [Actinomycetota bacterium]